ncbi:MAG: type II toxin-antitoxin system HicB family antitoxin [Chloroflexota bacterium]|nr:type II toxin-antitoxin system HicB family antitoxin [Chloroflexota bacterium]
MERRRYVVVIEPTETGFSAYVPDVLGCVSTGATQQEVENNIREALEGHLACMTEDGAAIPEAVSEAVTVDVRLPVVRVA